MSSPTTTFDQDSVASAADLASLKAEASCPICLQYFKNPVTIKCGHNFCLSCIRESWKGLTGSFPCPSCHFSCPEREFSSNQQLGHLTEVVKLLPLSTRQKKKEGKLMCAKHKQVLTSFCQKDLEVLCPQCSVSTKHTHHLICPVKKAALHHGKQLKHYIALWRERVEPFEKVITTQRRKFLELKKKVACRREEIKSEFEQLAVFLQSERESVLEQLQDEELRILAELKENSARFSAHVSFLKQLLKQVQSDQRKSEVELLERVKNIYQSSNDLKRPDLSSFKLKECGYRLPPQFSSLIRIIKRFWVEVRLDPDTAYFKLAISEDRKTVQFGSRKMLQRNSTFVYTPAILGSTGYSSGRWYWQVEVKDKPKWALGVYTEHVSRNNVIWGFGLSSQNRYFAVSSNKSIRVLPKVTPYKIGVFLDMDMGEVSFYNLDDKSLLHSFSDCFASTLWPYFYVEYGSCPLQICTVTDSE